MLSKILKTSEYLYLGCKRVLSSLLQDLPQSPDSFPQYLDISHNAWGFCNESITGDEVKEWSRPRFNTEAEWGWAIHHSSCLKWPFSRWGLQPPPSQATKHVNRTVLSVTITVRFGKLQGLLQWFGFCLVKHSPCLGYFLYQSISSNIVRNGYPQEKKLNQVLAIFLFEGPNCK